MSAIEATIQQLNPSTGVDGNDGELRCTRLGQLYSAGWREELLLGGYCYNVTVGSVSAGGDVALVTGGGAGTTIDSDQPELLVGVDSGYYLIPLRFQASCQVDLDADGEVANIIFFADTAKAPPGSVTGTTATPVPLLGGGPAATGRAFHTITVDVTDPVVSAMLAFRTIKAADAGTAASQQIQDLSIEYAPAVPPLFVGPCSLVACWGGTAAVTAIASLDYAIVPQSRYAQ